MTPSIARYNDNRPAPSETNLTREKDGPTAWGTVPGSMNGSGLQTLTATVTLNDSQIKALKSSPVEIVPAPGADKLLVLVSAVARVDNSQADYSGFGADDSGNAFVYFQYAGSSYASTQCYANILLADPSGDGFCVFAQATQSDFQITDPDTGAVAFFTTRQLPLVDGVSSTRFNKALQLAASNTTGADFTGGDPANSMQVKVQYLVVDMS